MLKRKIVTLNEQTYCSEKKKIFQHKKKINVIWKSFWLRFFKEKREICTYLYS